MRQALLETLSRALRSDAIMRPVSGRCAPRKTSKLRPVLSRALAVATPVGHDCPIVFRGEHRHSTLDATRLKPALGLALHCTTTPDGYSVAVHGENLHMLLRALARVEHGVLCGISGTAGPSVATQLVSRSVSRLFRHLTLAPGFTELSMA